MASDPITSRHPSAAEIIARATCRADAAEALTLSATRLHTEQCDRWMKERQPIAAADTLRVWGTAREGCRAACECVEMLFHSAGASGAKRGDRLQRYFRDVQMYRIHFQSQAITPMLRAQLLLGTEVPLPFRAATAPSAPR